MSQNDRIEVVVIEDSPIVREAIVEILEADSSMRVVATASTGVGGVDAVKSHDPDLVTCDIGLPDIDGFEVVERLMAEHPVPIVMLTATLRPDWRRDAYHALSLGAIEVIEKPGVRELNDSEWRSRLQRELKLVARSPVIPHVLERIKKRHENLPSESATETVPSPPLSVPSTKVDVVVIAGSAGGPKAARSVLASMAPAMPLSVPVLVALHLGPNMGASFAGFLSTSLNQRVTELEDGEVLEAGRIYVAPGRHHTELHAKNQVRVFEHLPGATHTPSLDYLLWSVARVHGSNAIGVMLTGMGADGARGLLAMRRFGAFTIGQDEASSLVYGMPKVAADLGAVVVQLSPEQIAVSIVDRVRLSVGAHDD